MMPKHALIVDDSQLAQFVLKKMLKEEAINAECSGSAEEALDYLKNNKPDIIFLDHTMPGMNGLELLKHLKADAQTRTIPVMMYTSQEDQRYAEQAIALGALEVLPKQLKRPDLHRVLITLDENIGQQQPNPLQEEHDALEQIVYNAEEALKYETWQQRFKQRFEEHREASSEQIQQLNERIDRLMLHQEDQPHKRQLFWNNIFWLVVFIIALCAFIFVYIQQQQALDALNTQLNRPAAEPVVTEPLTIQQAPSRSVVEPPSPKPVLTNSGNLDEEQFAELEEYFNSYRIPFDELLLGSTALAMLEEIDTILSSESFKGTILLTPQDSVFCITTSNSGQVSLANENLLARQCQFSTVNTQLTSNTSVELQQFINNNNSANQNYQYVIGAIEDNRANLPAILDDTTANDWNTIANNNRRIEFDFQPSL